ncbi:MAG: N-formylglutamate amidohydrolase [Lysobacterales bacterium]
MASLLYAAASPPIAILNREGKGGVVLLCEHASNYIPAGYDRLGLTPADLDRHIAWDIGAQAVAEQLAVILDAPLAYATHSRLLLDLNRHPDAPDSIATLSEDTAIPGNLEVSAIERRLRGDWLYAPFHAGVDALIDQRLAFGLATVVVSIHSFTPVYLGVPRPWQVGVLGARDRRLADAWLAALRADPTLTVGDNQPYAPRDGVYHSLDRHGERRGLPSAMIELRNDLITDAVGQREWAARLGDTLHQALAGLPSAGTAPLRRRSPEVQSN